MNSWAAMIATSGSASGHAAAWANASTSRFWASAGGGLGTLEHAAPTSRTPESSTDRAAMGLPPGLVLWLYIQPSNQEMPAASGGFGPRLPIGGSTARSGMAEAGAGASLPGMLREESGAPPIGRQIAALDWTRIEADLSQDGYATLGGVLTPAEGANLAAGYDLDAAFRSRVVMASHGFGSGEYKYYAYPLPEPISTLRRELYEFLAPIANRWAAMLGEAEPHPPPHPQVLDPCHPAGPLPPNPPLPRYGPR